MYLVTKFIVMKNIIYTLLFSCFILFANAQSKDESAIRTIISAQQDAWNNGNLEAFMEGYWKSDSLMFIGKSGVTHGWQKTLENYQKSYPDTAAMGKLQFDLLEVKRLSVLYFHVVGKWHLARSAGDLQGHFTLVFKRIGNRWYIVSDHSS